MVDGCCESEGESFIFFESMGFKLLGLFLSTFLSCTVYTALSVLYDGRVLENTKSGDGQCQNVEPIIFEILGFPSQHMPFRT